MSEHPNSGAAQFRADVPVKIEPAAIEQEAVRTTIVGGRPPGSGQPIGPVPRGIEILLKKAVVDPEFRKLLLDDPNQAAASIELELDPVESAMLRTFPKEQLAAVIDKTQVPQTQRRAFLGHTAALMLTVLGGATFIAGCPKGIRPDILTPHEDFRWNNRKEELDPPVTGIRPDVPEEESVEVGEPEPRPEPPVFSFGMDMLR